MQLIGLSFSAAASRSPDRISNPSVARSSASVCPTEGEESRGENKMERSWQQTRDENVRGPEVKCVQQGALS